jgi:prepilin-type processing-associated H-X9-DG protein
MTIAFACACGQHLQAADDVIGRHARCPVCGVRVTIPDPALLPFLPSGADAIPVALATALTASPPVQKVAEPAAPGPARRSRLASLALLCGVLAIAGPTVACSDVGGMGWIGLLALLGVPALVLGLIAQRRIGRSDGRLRGSGSAWTGVVTGVLSLALGLLVGLFTGVYAAKTAAKRLESMNNLHTIGRGLVTHHEATGQFPRADQNGLSWRVGILPYIEEEQLFHQFNHDEPWDSPTNRALLPRMPRIFRCPRHPPAGAGDGMTYYRAFVGRGTVMDDPENATLDAIDQANGCGHTLLVVEASDAVPWTKPDELAYDPTQPLPLLGPPNLTQFMALFADGHVQTFRKDVSPAILRQMIEWTNRQPFPLPQP